MRCLETLIGNKYVTIKQVDVRKEHHNGEEGRGERQRNKEKGKENKKEEEENKEEKGEEEEEKGDRRCRERFSTTKVLIISRRMRKE